MDRMTIPDGNGGWLLAGAPLQPGKGEMGSAAVQRLAQFENFYEAVAKEHEEAAAKLETLRQQGKKNSVQFREQFGKKMIDSSILLLLKLQGIE